MLTVQTDWIEMTEFGKKEKLLFKEFHDLTKFIRGVEYKAPNKIGNVGWHYKGNYEKIKVKYNLEYKNQEEKCEIMQLLSQKMSSSDSLINIIIDGSDVIFAENFRKYSILLGKI